MLKEEIMDIDDPSPPHNDSPQQPPQIKQEAGLSSKCNDFKFKLLARLETSDSTSMTKNLTLAITIQTMFNKDLGGINI